MLLVGIVLLSLLLAVCFYPAMPETMVSHWNALGEPDGYAPKALALFAVPAMSAAVVALFAAVPAMDPLKANIRKFRKQYDTFVALFAAFMLALQAEVVLWNLGMLVSPIVVLSVGIGVLFFYAGVLSESAKRNWFVGIRTPWTMSSERVWNKTHKLAGKLFKISGVLAAAGALLPDYAILLVLAPVIIVTIYSVAYSYVEYSKERRRSA
jgi:uncharacterized membrane protein